MPRSSMDSRMREYLELMSRQGAMDSSELYQRMMSRQVPTTAELEEMRLLQNQERAAKAARTKAIKQEEISLVEQFINYGTSHGLELLVNVELELLVKSQNRLKNMKTLFLLDSQKITLHNKRSKHLIPLLTKLAEDEGLTLDFVDEYPASSDGVRVAFWAFNNRREVDDTDIVLMARPQPPVVEEPMQMDELYEAVSYRRVAWDSPRQGFLEEIPF